jgi:CheY-like chemotaxis protein
MDDDELARKLLKTILIQANYEPLLTTSGDEALNLLHQQRPDLILMDMMMQDMDGMETTRLIKAADQFSAIPIIMVTGNSEIKSLPTV